MIKWLIESSQRRYIKERKITGTATYESTSEPVLAPLRKKGIAGLSESWRETKKLGAEYYRDPSTGVKREINALLMLLVAVPQYIIIASGYFRNSYQEEGDWKKRANSSDER